jgi:hypothetical protein
VKKLVEIQSEAKVRINENMLCSPNNVKGSDSVRLHVFIAIREAQC